MSSNSNSDNSSESENEHFVGEWSSEGASGMPRTFMINNSDSDSDGEENSYDPGGDYMDRQHARNLANQRSHPGMTSSDNFDSDLYYSSDDYYEGIARRFVGVSDDQQIHEAVVSSDSEYDSTDYCGSARYENRMAKNERNFMRQMRRNVVNYGQGGVYRTLQEAVNDITRTERLNNFNRSERRLNRNWADFADEEVEDQSYAASSNEVHSNAPTFAASSSAAASSSIATEVESEELTDFPALSHIKSKKRKSKQGQHKNKYYFPVAMCFREKTSPAFPPLSKIVDQGPPLPPSIIKLLPGQVSYKRILSHDISTLPQKCVFEPITGDLCTHYPHCRQMEPFVCYKNNIGYKKMVAAIDERRTKQCRILTARDWARRQRLFDEGCDKLIAQHKKKLEQSENGEQPSKKIDHKFHTINKNYCLGCGDNLEEDQTFIVLHKTRRQSHGLCSECLIVYLRGEIRDKLAEKHPDPFITCCGNIKKKSVCTERINLIPYATQTQLSRREDNLLDSIMKVVESDKNLRHDFMIWYCMTDPNSKMCPWDNCQNIILDLSNDMKIINCPYCNRDFCRQCNVFPAHTGRCDMSAAINLLYAGPSGDFFKGLIESGKAKLCPNCSCIIEKTNGCNHMKCQKCNEHFCWRCGDSISSDYMIHYDSVTGVESCRGRLFP